MMPATSNASSGDSVQRAASSVAKMTSAICSTGIVPAPRNVRPSQCSVQPHAAPSRNEPHTT